jgi:poly-gamma-glutamate synthesis protein (capsule biosynthesis protein)
MSPDNIDCITVAKIGCCVLANNHVLDWGYDGLSDTLNSLDRVAIKYTGAGKNCLESIKPAIIETYSGSRLIVFALGKENSGIPDEWASKDNKPGVALFESDPDWYLKNIAEYVKKNKRENDIVLLSIHWGENWGYGIPRDQIELAHTAIDYCGVDCIHGHSSHHPKGIEVYKSKIIFYGCGDLINDYEGISGYEEFRNDLALMYIVEFASDGNLKECKLFPMRIQHFSLKAAGEPGCKWFENIYRGSAKIRGADIIVNDRRSLRIAL